MKKVMYATLVVLLILQVFLPQLSSADSLKDSNNEASLNLKGVQLSDVTADEINDFPFNVTGLMKNTTGEKVMKEFTVSSNVKLYALDGGIIRDASKQEIGRYSIDGNRVKVEVPANIDADVTLTIGGKYAKDVTDSKKDDVVFSDSSGSVTQNVSLKADTPPVVTEKPETNVDKPSEQEKPSQNDTAKVTEPKQNTTPQQDTKKVAKPSNKAQVLADEPQDIKEIFAELGYSEEDSTILTGMEVTYMDDDGNPVEEPTVDDHIHFSFTWAIPDDVGAMIEAGDYYIVQLPDNVTIPQNISIPLNEYATVEVTTDGQVKFIFTDEVKGSSDVHGTLEFDADFNPDAIDGPGDAVIKIPNEDKLPPEEVVIKPSTDTTIEKSGTFDQQLNPDYVNWQVDFNKALDTITNAKVTESFPPGVTYESVKVYKVNVDLYGEIYEGSETLVTSGYTVDANGNVTFTTPISDAYRLIYKTKINEDQKPPGGGSVTFTNTATLSGDDFDDLPATASVTASYGKLLTKSGTNYNATDQTYEWTVKYNYGETTIPEEDAVLHDTFGNSSMVLVPGSVQMNKITFNPDGSEIQGAALVEGVDYNVVLTANGFDIVFLHDIDYAVKIKYRTSIDGTVDGNLSVSNTMQLESGEQSTAGGTMTQQNVDKKLGAVDYDNKRADWSIDINKNHYSMVNWSMTDQLSDGLTMDTSTFVMKDVDTGVTLVDGTDYDFHYDTGTNQFTVEFLGSYKAGTTDMFRMTYTTDFDTSVAGEDDPNRVFTNQATITWDDENGDSHNSTDTATLNPRDAAKYDGFKRGSYNARTSIITWSIGMNYNSGDLNDAQITDPIQGNQQYVDDSVRIYNYTVNPDGSVVKGAEIDNYGDFLIEEPSPANNETLTVHFPDGVSASYLIEFQTSLEGQLVAPTYHNDALFTNDTFPDHTLSADVSIANGGDMVAKTGSQDENGFVNWAVTINPSLSELHDVVMTDTPSPNQAIDENSIVVYRTIIRADGTIIKNPFLPLVEGVDYTVSLTTDNITGQQELKVSFLHTITTAYIVDYRAFVFLEGNSGTVNNGVTVTANNEIDVNDNTGVDVPVIVSDGGGTAVGQKGQITFKKVDANGNALQGAEFELLNMNKDTVIRNGVVDANGELTFGNISYGNYILRETKAPQGYSVSPTLAAGQEVTVSQASSENGIPVELVNTPNKVTLVKQNDDGQALSGAVFKLEKNTAGTWAELSPGTTYTTDANGQIEVDGLLPGDYRFIETEAPANYMLNTTPIDFTVTEESDGQIPDITLGPFINYQGSVEMMKQDEDGNIIRGALFAIKDQNGEVVRNLIAGLDGKVTADNLAPGNYTMTETRALNGYVLNTEAIPFTIPNQANTAPVTIDLGTFVNYKGSVVLTKEDEAGKALPGATFALEDEFGGILQEGLVSDETGKISIEDLAPGNYQFVETAPPDGYLLNTKPIPFTVDATTSGNPATIVLEDYVNYQGSVVLTKTDTTGKPLADAEFKASSVDGTTIAKNLKSDKNGKVKLANLAPGDYYFTETKAPPGYKLDDTKLPFTIVTEANDKPEEIQLTFTNEKLPPVAKPPVVKPPVAKPPITGSPTVVTPPSKNEQNPSVNATTGVKLPETGDTNNNGWFIVIGFAIIGLSGGYLLRRRKKSE
ncbi:SpaA isopeptide-forming pilin-related protein [Listeria booriae]|uniref:SpaA isopeptide-forming pilin-related protein n=1 Tax=Listeria booriae TaxID=1552123 RepID=UPI0028801C5A|nr:SpaA isopeptide-forming pilin-related protein [Listeria booriae]MDT0111231.1 SpaA isopeptide-forming pilin-related protein [Listeria booriae]